MRCAMLRGHVSLRRLARLSPGCSWRVLVTPSVARGTHTQPYRDSLKSCDSNFLNL